MIIKQWSLFLVWKNAWIASTYGNEESIVSLLEQWVVVWSELPQNLWYSTQIQAWVALYAWKDCIEDEAFIAHQTAIFSVEQEFWLLNRLDTPTAWMLYFAWDIDTYRQRKWLQKNNSIKKHYYAVVQWNIGNYFVYWSKNDDVVVTNKTITISRPLMHHIDDMSKMIAPVDQSWMKKWRGNVLHCKSEIALVEYNEAQDCSLVHVIIHQWRRHQIRVHCASLWHPIVWDALYTKKEVPSELLHLWSVGVELV